MNNKDVLMKVETQHKFIQRSLGKGDIVSKIQRIKAARNILNVGLKEAKEWIELNFQSHGWGAPIMPVSTHIPTLRIEWRGKVILEL